MSLEKLALMVIKVVCFTKYKYITDYFTLLVLIQ